MGYIPAPARGALVVADDEPASSADLVWLNRRDGTLRRFDDHTGLWLPLGEGNGLAGGAADTAVYGGFVATIPGAVVIGDGAGVHGTPS